MIDDLKWAQIEAENVCHKAKNLALALRDLAQNPENSLAWWILAYLGTEVHGVQSPNTFDAKSRDLHAFVLWFGETNGHLDIGGWWPRDTQAYLYHLENQGRAPATINRAFATVRRFARWAHDQGDHPTPFQHGLPTKGIRALYIEERRAKKFSDREIRALLKAADNLVLTETRRNSRPYRNRAILAVLYYTGMRVSELCALERGQYQGGEMKNVKRKGKTRSSEVYLIKACRGALDDYLAHERQRDDPEGNVERLFLGAGGKGLTRQQVTNVLGRIANEANKHRKDADKLRVHPHRLRHTAGARVRAQTGSDYETAAFLGHSSTKYVGMYGRPTKEEREQTLEKAFAG